jgi:hypothetical protein
VPFEEAVAGALARFEEVLDGAAGVVTAAAAAGTATSGVCACTGVGGVGGLGFGAYDAAIAASSAGGSVSTDWPRSPCATKCPVSTAHAKSCDRCDFDPKLAAAAIAPSCAFDSPHRDAAAPPATCFCKSSNTWGPKVVAH